MRVGVRGGVRGGVGRGEAYLEEWLNRGFTVTVRKKFILPIIFLRSGLKIKAPEIEQEYQLFILP